MHARDHYTLQPQDNIMEDCLDCPMCCMPLSNTARRPHSLPCGHTLCNPCFDILTGLGDVQCPTCHVHHVPEMTQFSAAYALETVIGVLKGAASFLMKTTRETSISSSGLLPTRTKEAPEELDWRVQSLLQLQMNEVVDAIQACEKEEARLDEYRNSLACWTEQQKQLQEKLDLLECSKNALVLVQDVESRAVAKRDEVQQGRQQLQTQLDALDNPTSRQEAFEALRDAVRVTKEARLKIRECQAAFSDKETVSAISRVTEATTAVVEAAPTSQAALDTPAAENAALASSSSSSTIMNMQLTLQSSPLVAQDLLSLSQSARQHLHANRVYAVHRTQSQTLYGRIILQDGSLYLHALENQLLPPSAVTVQVEEVMPATPPCLVFLDLVWPGSTPRRLLIRLSPDIPRGHQFLLLCTWQRGYSYASIRLLDVGNKGDERDFVCHCDYENKTGEGGAILLPGLDQEQYRESCQAGDVWVGWWGWYNPDKAAQFYITTRDTPNGHGGQVLGKVEVGVEDVLEAAQHSPSMEVTVVECGVVLRE